MAEQTGVIQEIKTKSVNVNGSQKTAYDLVVSGGTYGYGFFPPKATVGQFVKFEVEQRGNFQNVARGSLKVSANKPTAEAVAEAVATMPKQSTTGGSFDTRQDAISRQAASNTAIAWMALLQEAGALPSATTAKGKALEVLDTMRLKYEQEFYENNTGVKWKDISPSSDSTTVSSATPEAPADSEWQ